jgi:hypothetical protein
VDIGSKDLLIDLVGVYALQDYERVKRASMQLAGTLERRLVAHVGGRMALAGEGCDGITALGKWEFCLQRNTKNSAGKKADELRCPGRCV